MGRAHALDGLAASPSRTTPTRQGGSATCSKAAPAFCRLELRPIADEIASAVNDWMDEEVVGFGVFRVAQPDLPNN